VRCARLGPRQRTTTTRWCRATATSSSRRCSTCWPATRTRRSATRSSCASRTTPGTARVRILPLERWPRCLCGSSCACCTRAPPVAAPSRRMGTRRITLLLACTMWLTLLWFCCYSGSRQRSARSSARAGLSPAPALTRRGLCQRRHAAAPEPPPACAGTPSGAHVDQISDQIAFAAAAVNATWALAQPLPPRPVAAFGPASDWTVAADAPDTAPSGLPAPSSNLTFADT